MFNKIIEILEEAKVSNHFTKLDTAYDNGLDYAIKILEKNNNKPFNPLELGFTIESSKFGETRYKFKDISINDFQLLHDESGDNYSLFSDGIPDHFNFIKIPNHSFGVALLKSTDAFEEGEF